MRKSDNTSIKRTLVVLGFLVLLATLIVPNALGEEREITTEIEIQVQAPNNGSIGNVTLITEDWTKTYDTNTDLTNIIDIDFKRDFTCTSDLILDNVTTSCQTMIDEIRTISHRANDSVEFSEKYAHVIDLKGELQGKLEGCKESRELWLNKSTACEESLESSQESLNSCQESRRSQSNTRTECETKLEEAEQKADGKIGAYLIGALIGAAACWYFMKNKSPKHPARRQTENMSPRSI